MFNLSEYLKEKKYLVARRLWSTFWAFTASIKSGSQNGPKTFGMNMIFNNDYR